MSPMTEEYARKIREQQRLANEKARAERGEVVVKTVTEDPAPERKRRVRFLKPEDDNDGGDT